MLFLHGDGSRGDAKGELDYILRNGPLYEAWIQKRDLPFIIIAPQLPTYGREATVEFLKNRTRQDIPVRLEVGVPERPPETGDARAHDGRRRRRAAEHLDGLWSRAGLARAGGGSARPAGRRAANAPRGSDAGVLDRALLRRLRHLVPGEQTPGALRGDRADRRLRTPGADAGHRSGEAAGLVLRRRPRYLRAGEELLRGPQSARSARGPRAALHRSRQTWGTTSGRGSTRGGTCMPGCLHTASLDASPWHATCSTAETLQRPGSFQSCQHRPRKLHTCTCTCRRGPSSRCSCRRCSSGRLCARGQSSYFSRSPCC